MSRHARRLAVEHVNAVSEAHERAARNPRNANAPSAYHDGMQITAKGAFKFATARACAAALREYEAGGYGVLSVRDWKAAGAYAFIATTVEPDIDMVSWRESFEDVARAAQEGELDLAFAWLYPHFLEGQPAWLYVVAAPMGLVPCPSLALVLGAGLCADGFSSRAWSVIAGAAGIFYGLFGAFRLGVWLDLPLVAAAVLTLVTARRPTARRELTRS